MPLRTTYIALNIFGRIQEAKNLKKAIVGTVWTVLSLSLPASAATSNKFQVKGQTGDGFAPDVTFTSDNSLKSATLNGTATLNDYSSGTTKTKRRSDRVLMLSRTLLNWNLNPKLSTLSWGGSTSQNALVMLYNNLVADRQSQAGALSHRFGSEEGVE